jgi:prepilin-type N-terminal cleavage/methylation domain-containing protein
METSLSLRNSKPQRGFSLMETIVAIAVLSVGLMAMAALMTRMVSTTSRSGYMSVAMQLASEKLEDLNRYPADDPNVAIPTGTSAGSLTSDVVSTVTSGGESASVNYHDEVRLSATGGAVSEIDTAVDGSTGDTVYTTISHAPDGTVASSSSTTAPSDSGMVRFKRRWIIEKDQPTTGVRRVTVLVTLENPTDTPVTAQMSMVRP